MRNFMIAAAFAAVASLVAACADDKMMAAKEPTLYERLGGKPAITLVVDQFVANLAGDPRVNQRFAKTDIPKLKMHLVDQICEATGGPCTYTGKDMVTAHKGMNITQAEFNITGEHLAAALDKYNVPAKEKNELLTAIGAMQPQIVGQ
jgi:hemoglobin